MPGSAVRLRRDIGRLVFEIQPAHEPASAVRVIRLQRIKTGRLVILIFLGERIADRDFADRLGAFRLDRQLEVRREPTTFNRLPIGRLQPGPGRRPGGFRQGRQSLINPLANPLPP